MTILCVYIYIYTHTHIYIYIHILWYLQPQKNEILYIIWGVPRTTLLYTQNLPSPFAMSKWKWIKFSSRFLFCPGNYCWRELFLHLLHLWNPRPISGLPTCLGSAPFLLERRGAWTHRCYVSFSFGEGLDCAWPITRYNNLILDSWYLLLRLWFWHGLPGVYPSSFGPRDVFGSCNLSSRRVIFGCDAKKDPELSRNSHRKSSSDDLPI